MDYGKVIVVLIVLLSITGCMTVEERRVYQERRDRDMAACAQRGAVWYTRDSQPDRCMSAEEAKMLDERRWAEEQRQKDRETALHQACIRSGGTWYGTQCAGGQPVGTR